MATRASKRSRTEDAPPAALLDSAQTAELGHLARRLAELAGGAAHVPALAECSAQLSALLLAQQQAAEAAAAAADEGGEPAATAPFRRLPADVANLVLLHCDARSLGRISCASPFFGGGGQRSLVQRVAFGEARLALHTPALRPRDLSRLMQLSRLEDPVPMGVALLRQLAVLHRGKPGRRDEAARFYRRALEAEPNHKETLFDAAYMLAESPDTREEAMVLYRRRLVLEPDHVNTLCNLALLLDTEPGGREEVAVRAREAARASRALMI